MTEITPDILERALADKYYWRRLAAQIIAESSQRAQRNESESAIAGVGAQPIPLGRVHESHLLPRTRVRFPLVPGKGPRSLPMISEVSTITPSGSPVSQRKAERLKRQWNEVRLRAQERAQRGERGDAAGGEEEEEGDNPVQDHPGKSCSDAHAGMSHDDFLDQKEEEEEEVERQRPNVNPLFRNPRNSFDTTRRRQVRS